MGVGGDWNQLRGKPILPFLKVTLFSFLFLLSHLLFFFFSSFPLDGGNAVTETPERAATLYILFRGWIQIRLKRQAGLSEAEVQAGEVSVSVSPNKAWNAETPRLCDVKKQSDLEGL